MAREKNQPLRARIFLADPLVAHEYPTLGVDEVELRPGPVMLDGPVSARFAVVDYNASERKLLPPAWYDGEGFEARPGSAQFRQVNAWAVAQRTLEMYEHPQALGRRIPWAFRGSRLFILPNAGYWENAFYDRDTRTLQFFYFQGPDEPIYTSLSHDIISHETGHAILDGIRPDYNEHSSPDTAGFHEFLGDATAILCALEHRKYREALIQSTGGDLRKKNIVADLAEQFGMGVAGAATYGEADRYFLRTALHDRTMEHVKGDWEAHAYSEVLTGAFYDILVGIFEKQEMEANRKLKGRGRKPNLVRVLSTAVQHLKRMTLRALDYCPPADLDYLDYARALLHADALAYPNDGLKYRDMAAKIFLRRKIARREKELQVRPGPARSDFEGCEFAEIDESPVAAYHFLDRNRGLLDIPENQDFRVVGLYGNAKEGDRAYQMPRELILTYVWEEDIRLRGPRFGALDGKSVPLLCGGTLVFDERANPLYWARKKSTDRRKKQLRDYLAYLIRHHELATPDDPPTLDRPVRATLEAGRVRLRTNPRVRHRGRGQPRWLA
jgi:hypothetical protein